jgi:glycosyltransferase involved in cell wall biosynthesis
VSTKRIAFFTLNYAPETTGIAPYSTGLAEGLVERGAHVRVFTGFPHYPEWKRRNGVASNQTINGVSVQRLEHPVPPRPGMKDRMVMEALFALRCLRARLDRPDLLMVVSPSLLSAAAVVLRGRLARIPVVVWVQDLYGLGAAETGMLGGLGGALLVKLESLILQGASRVVAIHQRLATKLTDIGVDPDKILVIRNWCHVGRCPSTVDRQEARRRQGWHEDEFVVLHAGNMGRKQGLENVVEAGRLAEGSSVRFVLLGDGNQRQKLEQLAAGLGNVTIVDPVADDDFMSTLQAADALLVNEKETLSDMAVPSKLTSYFAAGRPVVGAVNPAGVTAEEIQSSGAGIVLGAGDPVALLTGVKNVAGDPDGQRHMSDAGRSYQERMLQEQVALDAFEALVRTLTRAKNSHKTRRV